MIKEYCGYRPIIGKGCFIHESAVLIGEVVLMDEVSIWPGAVIRGDTCRIVIGKGSNIQDNAVLHGGYFSAKDTMEIGENVIVGHGAILHGCYVGDCTLIGMGSIVLDNAVVGKECIIGAGTLIPQKKNVPDRSLALGSPFKILREVTPEEAADLLHQAQDYNKQAKEYKK